MRRPPPDAIYQAHERPCKPGRPCAHPGCSGAGRYRAPKERHRLTDYHWFCLDHIRDYNRAWDFYAGMNEAEIEQQRRADTVWRRPSWPLGLFGERARSRSGFRIHDGFDAFGGFGGASRHGAPPRGPAPQSEEEKALALLDLQHPVTSQDVKSRYKTLVKQLHPDANGGDRAAEERLKTVNQAYAALKLSFA